MCTETVRSIQSAAPALAAGTAAVETGRAYALGLNSFALRACFFLILTGYLIAFSVNTP